MVKRVVPNDSQLIVLAAEAVKNASRKQDAARRMLDAGGDPSTAFFVAAMALEELGKSFVVSTLFSMPAADRAAKAPTMLANHQFKLLMAHTMIRMCVDDAELPHNSNELFDQILTTSTGTNDVKFRGMYVDVTEDGVLTPDVPEDEARSLVELAGRAVEVLTSQGMTLDGSEDPDQFQAFLEHMVKSPAAAVVAQQIDGDPTPVLRQFRSVVRDKGPVPRWLIEMLPPGTVPESTDAE